QMVSAAPNARERSEAEVIAETAIEFRLVGGGLHWAENDIIASGGMCSFFFSSRRRHTRFDCDWSSDVCSSDLVIAVARRGKLVYYEALGFRDKVAGVAMTKDTIFNIASMTKPMVAFAALQLHERGQLLIDDPRSEERRVGKECRARWTRGVGTK